MSTKRVAVSGIFLALSIIGSTPFTYSQGIQSGPDSKATLLNVGSENEAIDSSLSIAPQSGDNDTASLATLELRSGRQTCRGVADLSQLAQKCQTNGSAPLIRQ